MMDIKNEIPGNLTCDTFRIHNVTHFITGEYGGIPENLLINVVVWLVLLILFSILRKIAWDYGRIALVSRNEENNTLRGEKNYNVWTTLFYGDHDRSNLIGSHESLDTTLHLQDKGFCSWIPAFFRVKDSDILRKSGQDAIQYLSFQRYLLVYLAIVCVISTAIVIPVNFQGDNLGNTTDFGHTTIGNLDTNSQLLWIHACLAVVYLMLAVFIMRRFTASVQFDDDEQVTRTLMISNIPNDKCFKNIMVQHFQEAYPECLVLDVQFAYDIAKLVTVYKQRKRMTESKQNSDMEFKKTSSRPLMTPLHCGQCCCCCGCCGCDKVDAIEYYAEKEAILMEKVDAEKVHAYQNPLGIAFLTYETEIMAERVRTDFHASCKGAHNPQPSSLYRELNVQEWSVKYAPSPKNIHWENLSVTPWKWWTRAVIINSVLVILLFFLTTPSIIMTSLDQINYKTALDNLHSAVVSQFLPTILLWTFAALLPNLVYYSDQFVGHWTRTAEHHSVMRKSFVFLLLMILILPSLGLTSVQAFFEWAVLDKNHRYRWRCIFLSGNGAFLVNYVITSAFIGTGLELIRFSELFMYCMHLLCARSAAEKTTVRKSVLWEFQFGCQYAWMLCLFAVIITYSIPCPLIAPFGLVYLGLKHLVDRYNIYFSYGPSQINKNIHTTAVNFVIASVILLQFSIVFFTALRADAIEAVFVFSAIALFITMIVFCGRLCFGWFKGFSPVQYRQFDERRDRQEEPVAPFVADVLLENKLDIGSGLNGVPQQTYGSMTAPSVNADTTSEEE